MVISPLGSPVGLAHTSPLPKVMSLAIALGVTMGALPDIIVVPDWTGVPTMFAPVSRGTLSSFWLGIVSLCFFDFQLCWFPFRQNAEQRRPALLPVSPGFEASAVIARLVPSTILQATDYDCSWPSSAKELVTKNIIVFHTVRNSLIPVITIGGMQFGWLLRGGEH